MSFFCWQYHYIPIWFLFSSFVLSFFLSNPLIGGLVSWWVKHSSMMYLRVGSKLDCFLLMMIFFPGRWCSFMEKLKAISISIVHGTSALTLTVFLFKYLQKTGPPSFIQIVTKWQTVCSCGATLTSIWSEVICVLLSNKTIQIGLIGSAGGQDVLPVPYLWKGHSNHSINDRYYMFNCDNHPWHGAPPVTDTGLCDVNDALCFSCDWSYEKDVHNFWE